ncbi:serpin family protein [Ornithinimicrobium pratense]|nr:serpin family protein [Ornithinimicrobium pratense]
MAVPLSLAALLVLPACGQQTAQPEEASPEGTLPVAQLDRRAVSVQEAKAIEDLVVAADGMGLELINLQPEVTTVTSPASLQVALSMAAEGAEGQTLSELEALIGATGTGRSDAMNALMTALEDLDGDPAVVQDDELPETPMVHRADRLVLDDTLVVKQDFVDALARHYGATSETTDLGSEAGKAVLDSWVNEHTGGLVPQSAIKPDPGLRLVLQDAIVLAARWQDPYYAALTSPEQFTLPTGEVVDLDMMDTGRERDTIYAEVDGWQAVRLPYTGGRLHADVILPPLGTAPTQASTELLAQLQGQLDADQSRLVILRMPVVDATSKLDLRPFLSEHAPSALAGGFGGIADEDLAIDQAAQQGVLAIDEEGTIAAAVTEIGFPVSGTAQPPLKLTVDRPYLVHIADSTTGWPLFLAHIADPRRMNN